MFKILKSFLILFLMILIINNGYVEGAFGIGDVSEKLKGEETKDITTSFTNLFSYILGFTGFFAVVFAMKGGASMMTSAGDEDKFKNGKKTLIFSLVGLLVILLAYTIVSTSFSTMKEIADK